MGLASAGLVLQEEGLECQRQGIHFGS